MGPLVQVRIKENALVARVAAFKLGASKRGAAIVFGRTIYLFRVTKDQILNDLPYLRHEVAHVLQYQREGFIRFLMKYVWYSIRFGYLQNPFEIEAREAQTDKEILNKVWVL